MSIHPASPNPFEAARLSLINALLKLKAPKAYPNFPCPDDHEGIGGHIKEALEIVDEWLAAIGSEVRDNAVTSVDARLFSGTLVAAASDEIYACDEQAEALRQYADERRASRRA
jgi:hypothetical protein